MLQTPLTPHSEIRGKMTDENDPSSKLTINDAIKEYIQYIDSLPQPLLSMSITEFEQRYSGNLAAALKDFSPK